jgi:hypothetical protein
VSLCQRLGYAVVFDPIRPGGLHYRLRMYRPDEYQIAWRLHRMALTAQHNCFEVNVCPAQRSLQALQENGRSLRAPTHSLLHTLSGGAQRAYTWEACG